MGMRHGLRMAALGAICGGALIVAFSGMALAVQPRLWKSCPKGSAAALCAIPRGIATNPNDGHVYLADQNNQRVMEFSAWGQFVKAWGWGVKDGASELQTCTNATTCRKGLGGAGAGQFGAESPQGIAVDSTSSVYVVDRANHRVERFDPAGTFLYMFGGGVNATSGGNLCPRPGFPADVCKAGTVGTENGQFSDWPFSSFIAIGPANQVYVGDKDRIQEFSSSGTYQRQISLPAPGMVGSLAVDPVSGDLYFSNPNPETVPFSEANHDVFRLDPSTGAVVDTLEVGIPRAVAVGADGGVYVFDQRAEGNSFSPGNHISRIQKFDAAGNFVESVAQNKDEGSSTADQFETSTGLAVGSACFVSGRDIYVSNSTESSFISAYGPAPDKYTGKGEKCEPPEVPPTVTQQYALSVGANDATLGARINPHFWSDTAYYVEYGFSKCSEGGCLAKQPTPPGAALGGGVVDAEVPTAGVFVSGLVPGTTYHYRFVAKSSGGGPVVGQEGTFTTFKEGIGRACPANEAFRSGASAGLSDCRVYEMVSPIDKEGGDIEVLGKTNRLDQSAVSGDGLTYSSYRAFGGPLSGPFASQYVATRLPGVEWESRPVSPPQEGENVLPTEYSQLDSLFKSFSPDLSTAWNVTFTEPVLGPGGQAGFPNVYRRDNKGAGSYRACSAATPAKAEIAGPEFQIAAADQNHAAFRTRNKLTPDAGEESNTQIYSCAFNGEEVATVRFVSALPNGSPSQLENSVGTVAASFVGNSLHGVWLANGMSEDGSRIFWTASSANSGPGTIYVRVNASEEESKHNGSGKCTQSFKACTYPVSGSAGVEPARFWGATPDGATALFAVEGKAPGDLYLFDVDKQIKGEEPKTLVAHKTLGVVGTSTDLTRIYFLSEEQIGGEGAAGKPNLYLYEGGGAPVTTFIATLSATDASPVDIASPVNERPDRHTARVSSDGSNLAFTSNSSALAQAIAGYDNTDRESGEPDVEVYRYSLGGSVACLSCNPTGARPAGGRLIGKTNNGSVLAFGIGRLAPWMTATYPGRPLSEDGSRVFFESFESLALADTNGKADVYEWEEVGAGDCVEADPSFVPASGGCVNLISSGKSPADSEFIDASPDGRDVFFATAASLLPQDPGSIDLYDARAGGGLPIPPPATPECEGQACQSPPAAPSDPTPSSSTFHGPGNQKPGGPQRKSCAKGKHKVKKNGKVSCVKKHKSTKRANKNGRAGR